jgi:hypothetical protein
MEKIMLKPLLVSLAFALTTSFALPGVANAANLANASAEQPEKTKKAKKAKKPKQPPTTAKFVNGSAESTKERERRLKRECKGKPNAGACEGYTR